MQMRITLWANAKKKNDKSPDFTGVVNKDGSDLDVALWFARERNEETGESGDYRKDKNGNRFLQGRISPPGSRTYKKKASSDPFD